MQAELAFDEAELCRRDQPSVRPAPTRFTAYCHARAGGHPVTTGLAIIVPLGLLDRPLSRTMT
jgi:hypothetical protein